MAARDDTVARIDAAIAADDVEVSAGELGPGAGWPEPQPISGHEAAPVEYPIDALPSAFRAAVLEVRAITQAPLALCATIALALVALAVQALANVARSRHLIGPVSFSVLAFALSGERKTFVERLLLPPFLKWEAEAREALAGELAEHEAAMEVYDAKLAGLRDAIRSQAKKCGDTEHLESELEALVAARPVAPPQPRLVFTDATPEALIWGLAHNWPSAGLVSSEAGTVLGGHGMSSDSAMRNFAFLNCAWDGQPLRVDRRTSESFVAADVRLTTLLQVQPGTWHEFVKKSGTLARDIGWTARFLITAPPSTQGTRFFREHGPTPALDAHNLRIRNLLDRPLPLDEKGRLAPPTLRFSAEGQRMWVEAHDEFEKRLAVGGELAGIRDVASKGAENVARVAAVLHLLEDAEGDISGRLVNSAAQIVAFHLGEAARLLGDPAADQVEADAEKVEVYIRRNIRAREGLRIPRREVHSRCAVRNSKRFAAAVELLERRHRLRCDGGELVVNPALVA